MTRIMESDRKWIVVKIDGKTAAISTDYRLFASIAAKLAGSKTPSYDRICAETVTFDEVWRLRMETKWEDLVLFGTEFQKKVWKRLYNLTHDSEGNPQSPRLISYSDFADICENRAGVRAVAHAVGLNPLAVLIPCHLVVPKESIDRIQEIQKKAESTIFKGDDLCIDSLLREKGIDFGEYTLGRKLKKELIRMELSPLVPYTKPWIN